MGDVTMQGNQHTIEWRPVAEIIPKEIPVGHGGASFGPVLLTDGENVWAGEIRLLNGVNGVFVSCDVHGVTGQEWEPQWDKPTHYARLPPPYKEVKNDAHS